MSIKTFLFRYVVIIAIFAVLVSYQGKSQNKNIGFGTLTPNNSALVDMDVNDPAFTTKLGLLIPRVALTGTSDASTILSPAISLLIYNTASVSDVVPGFYYWNGTQWVKLTTIDEANQYLPLAGGTMSGNIDMSNNLITNIGNANTDFTATGGLNLADALSVASGGISITGNSTIAGTLSSLTGLTSSGIITFSALNSAGVVKNDASGVLSTGLINLTNEVSGILPVSNGGIGQSNAPAIGQLLIGNGTNFALNTITAGDNIDITNAAGSITIAATGFESPLTFNAPLTRNVNTVSIPVANTSTNGYLSSTDWNTFNNKENSIALGTAAQYYRGDKTWADFPSSLPPSGAAGGDLSGTYPNPNVIRIQNRDVASTVPNNNDILKWNGTAWAPALDANTEYTAGTGLNLTGTVFSANFGTTAETIAAGNHTHDQLHNRQHSIGSAEDHTATAWRMFYSNEAGNIVELVLGTNGQVLQSNGASSAPQWSDAGTGTVTSVELTMPAQFSVAGSPITEAGTFEVAWGTQNQNLVFAAPSDANGLPTFRLLDALDIPNLSTAQLTSGILPVARGGSGANDLTGMLKGNGTDAFTGVSATQGQITYWTDNNTIDGTAEITWDGTTFTIDGDLVVTGEIDPISIQLIPQANPPSPAEGKIYYDNNTKELKVRKESDWDFIVSSPVEFAFPSASGNEGDVLTTDGAGNLTWSAPSAGGGGSSTPVGTIIMFAGTTAPDGWLICNGSAINRTTYSALFAVISTTYGVGDGTSTFNLPQLSGRFALGSSAEYGLGSTGGEATHTLTVAEIPSHKHSLRAYSTGSLGNEANNSILGPAGIYSTASNSPNRTLHSNSIDNTGGGQAHNNMPPYQAINYIIKY